MANTAQFWIARADDHGPAVLFEEQTSTWAEMVAGATARGWMAIDLRRRGQPFHIGVLLENTPEHIAWTGAAALSGATVVSINSTRRGAELASDIRHTDCQVVVTDRAGAALLSGLDTGVPDERLILVDGPRYRDLLAGYPTDRFPDIDPAEDELLFLLFTSGSTGRPKAVQCTQGRVARTAEICVDRFDIHRGMTTYLAMPLFHGNSLFSNWAPVLASGATVGLRRRFSASGFLPDIRKFNASYFNFVGRALAYILATPDAPDDATNPLELAFGTEASARDKARFVERFGCQLLESFGGTENSIIIRPTPDTPLGALGQPPPGDEVAVLDPLTERECPRAVFDGKGTLLNGTEAIGELVGLNTAGRFEGYYANPTANAERVRDGRYWSGDLGYRDEKGFFYFAGRTADWLRVDSENFAAAPIERILDRLPNIVVSAVYAVPDPRTGDQVMAALEVDEVAAFDGRSFGELLDAQPDLGTKWAPRFVRLVSSMPQTANHKVAKASLRNEQWQTDDPVWWRPSRGDAYRLLTSDDRAGLLAEFDAPDRINLAPAPFQAGA